MASTIVHRRSQVGTLSGLRAAWASTAAHSPSSMTSPWYSKACSRLRPLGNVLAASSLSSNSMPSTAPLRRLVKPPEQRNSLRRVRPPRPPHGYWPKSPALEGGQEALVPVDLADGGDIVLEEGRRPAPAIEEAAHPDPRDQSDAHFDAASPVHAGGYGVGPPPRTQLRVDQLGVAILPAEAPCRSEHGEVMVRDSSHTCLMWRGSPGAR